MTASPRVRTVLMVGGPAHGRWIVTQELYNSIRVAIPPNPGSRHSVGEIEYTPRDLYILGRVLRIWAPKYMDGSALDTAAFNLLLSDGAKAAAL